jgi:hypothetical protein
MLPALLTGFSIVEERHLMGCSFPAGKMWNEPTGGKRRLADKGGQQGNAACQARMKMALAFGWRAVLCFLFLRRDGRLMHGLRTRL